MTFILTGYDGPLIDMVDYTKATSYHTICLLARDRDIDTVYVRFASKDQDDCFHCENPSHMNILKWIINSDGPNVIGWRCHNHKRITHNGPLQIQPSKPKVKLTNEDDTRSKEKMYDKEVAHFIPTPK